RSSDACVCSLPVTADAIAPFTCDTALRTPFPPYLPLSPSRSSSASREPVDAPEGTAARPNPPPVTVPSTSTVGLPRESRISRPTTRLICTKKPLKKRRQATGFRLQVLQELARRVVSSCVPFALDGEGAFCDGGDERIVIRCHDNDAAIGDRVALAIF